jgi:hypothetical protein
MPLYPLLNTLPLTHPPAPFSMLKALWDKRLRDVDKTLKIKELKHCLALV